MEKHPKNEIDDDLPPELEELPTEMIKKQGETKTKQGVVDYGDYTQVKEEAPIVKSKQSTEQFGDTGLKKGFFSSQPSTGSTKKPAVKSEESDIIKPQKKKDPNVLDEVQEAMKVNQSFMNKSNEWMTPELLAKIAQNPKLLKLFANQEYMQAIGLMQTKPKEVMEKYGNNLEFKELLVEFSKMMGEHFENLAKTATQQQTQQPETKLDKEVEAILSDPKVKKFLEFLQKNQKVDFHRVMATDPELGQKLRVLIQKGYINMQSY